MNNQYLIAVGDIAGFETKVRYTEDFIQLNGLVDEFIDYLNHTTCYLNGKHIQLIAILYQLSRTCLEIIIEKGQSEHPNLDLLILIC
jgi:hypothetical protein